MRKILVLSVAVVAGVLGTSGLEPTALAASTGNGASHTGAIVSEEPSKATPNILDGTVNSMTQVGNMIVVGGTFTQVRNPNSSTTLVRNRLLAFDATTGKVSTTFAPNPDGVVNKVQAAADNTSVYVGGAFTSAAGVSA